ncbi:hypothetical protein [Spirosoma knui]
MNTDDSTYQPHRLHPTRDRYERLRKLGFVEEPSLTDLFFWGWPDQLVRPADPYSRIQ